MPVLIGKGFGPYRPIPIAISCTFLCNGSTADRSPRNPAVTSDFINEGAMFATTLITPTAPSDIIGHVKGRRCLLIDDIVDSAGTLCNAAVALMEAGAKSVSAYVTHGVLSGGAVARVAASPLEELVMTDSIQATEAVRVAQNTRQITIAPLLGEAMSRISDERSVSSLFD